jgi:hypothetical protein
MTSCWYGLFYDAPAVYAASTPFTGTILWFSTVVLPHPCEAKVLLDGIEYED